LSPPLLKVVVTVTTTFLECSLQFFKQVEVSQYCDFTHKGAIESSRHGKTTPTADSASVINLSA